MRITLKSICSVAALYGLIFLASQKLQTGSDDGFRFNGEAGQLMELSTESRRIVFSDGLLHVALMVCDPSDIPRVTLIIKSCVMFHDSPQIHFHIVSTDANKHFLNLAAKHWSSWFKGENYFFVSFYTVDRASNKKWFSTQEMCQSQVLFLHKILPLDVDKVIFLGTKAIVIDSLALMWKAFDSFGDKVQYGADRSDAFVNGVSSSDGHLSKQANISDGVLLMHIDNIRTSLVGKDYENYRQDLQVTELSSGDARKFNLQSILQRYFQSHPQLVRFLSCSLTYHTTACISTNETHSDTIMHGPAILHFDNKVTDARFTLYTVLSYIVDQFDFSENVLKYATRNIACSLKDVVCSHFKTLMFRRRDGVYKKKFASWKS